MESAIEQILFGKRTSWDVRVSGRDKEVLDKVVENEAVFLKTLIGEQSELFEQYVNAVDVLHCEERIEYYKEGFRLGFLLSSTCQRDRPLIKGKRAVIPRR